MKAARRAPHPVIPMPGPVLPAVFMASFLFFSKLPAARAAECPSDLTPASLPCSISLKAKEAAEPELKFPGFSLQENDIGALIFPEDWFAFESRDSRVRADASRRVFLRAGLSEKMFKQLVELFSPGTFEKYKSPKKQEDKSLFERKVSMVYNALLEHSFITQPLIASLFPYFIPELNDPKRMREIFGQDKPNEQFVKNLFDAADLAKYGPGGNKEREQRVELAWARLQKFIENMRLVAGTIKHRSVSGGQVKISLNVGAVMIDASGIPLDFTFPFRGAKSPFFHHMRDVGRWQLDAFFDSREFSGFLKTSDRSSAEFSASKGGWRFAHYTKF